MKTGVKHIVLVGNTCEGYEANGPFDSFDEACEFAREANDHWDIMPLFPPETKVD